MLEYTAELCVIVLRKKQQPIDLKANHFFIVVKFSINPVDIEKKSYMSYMIIYLRIQFSFHTQPYSYHTVLLSSETSSGGSASLVFTQVVGANSLVRADRRSL